MLITITNTMHDIVIGPWLRNIAKIQPTTGRSTSQSGGVQVVKLPAPVGELVAISVLR